MDSLNSLQEYHCLLTAHKIILAYGGEIKKGVVSNLMNIIDDYLEGEKNISLKRRVQQVVVECVQNIERHSGGFGDEKNTASIVLLKQKEDYQVTFNNRVHNSSIKPLSDKIEKINSLSREELIDFYKKSLRENTISDKGGAGLGLIEISRRAGGKIDYDFEPGGEEDSRFSMMVTISNKI